MHSLMTSRTNGTGLNRYHFKLYDKTEYLNACKIGKFEAFCDGKQFGWNSTMLVYGFIRNTNKKIKQQIIAYDLYQICFQFFYTESMESLTKRRNQAKEFKNIHKLSQIEELILYETCNNPQIQNNSNMLYFYQKILKEILNEWEMDNKIDEYRLYINECIKQCVKIDNVDILQIMLYRTGYIKNGYGSYIALRVNEMFDFMNYAARYNAFECIKLLFEYHMDWIHQIQPICLLNAVKYNPENIELINYIINKLKITGISFICNDVMQEVIRYDLVDIAKIIMDNRWHKLTQKDIFHAELLNARCHELFAQKLQILKYEFINNEDDELSWNDQEWENDESDEFDQDNDDWENAM